LLLTTQYLLGTTLVYGPLSILFIQNLLKEATGFEPR